MGYKPRPRVSETVQGGGALSGVRLTNIPHNTSTVKPAFGRAWQPGVGAPITGRAGIPPLTDMAVAAHVDFQVGDGTWFARRGDPTYAPIPTSRGPLPRPPGVDPPVLPTYVC